MKLGRRAEPFNDPSWLYELKWDGFRTLACIEGGQCELKSRNGHRFNQWPCLAAALSRLMLNNAILDGETVCLDDQGRPVFKPLLFGQGPPVFCAFDLLWLNGQDLRGEPLLFRKDRLRDLITRQSGHVRQHLRYIDHIDGQDGTIFFQMCCSHDLEGVVAKRIDSTYFDTDQESAWLKIKNRNYSQAVDRHELFERHAHGENHSQVSLEELTARAQHCIQRAREYRAQLQRSIHSLSRTLEHCTSTQSRSRHLRARPLAAGTKHASQRLAIPSALETIQ